MGKRSRSLKSRRTEAASALPTSARRWPSSRILAVVGLLVALVGAAGGLVLVAVNAAQPVYACGSLLEPAASPSAVAATSAPLASATLSAPTPIGQDAPDLGRNHVPVGGRATYSSCPPTSGPHYNAAGQGPIPVGFYPPDESRPPQGWVHNLEHGEMVVLYRCPGGSCDQPALYALRAFQQNIPPSPRCGIPNDLVVTRFDEMNAPFAAVTWDRVLFLDRVDTAALSQFFLANAETKAPERQC